MCIPMMLRFTSKNKVMGNCMRLRRHESSSSSSMGADDDDHDDEGWDSSVGTKKRIPEKQDLLDHEHSKGKAESTSSVHSSSINNKEIKIKISKKQLEQLLGEVDVHELPVDQVLSRLINASDHQQLSQMLNDHQRSWRPRLQSIPEVD